MSPSPQALAHIEARRRLALATALATHRLWRQVDHGNLHQSWLGLAGNVLAVTMGGQLAAAQMTAPWLTGLLGADEDRPDADTVVPQAFTGVDGSGRPLAGVLMAPIWTALRLVTQGRPLVQAMAAGQGLLDAIVATAVADTGRAADAVAMTAKPTVTGYIRVVEAGACDRCIVLAGNEYHTDKAFLRHPRCHCGMEPVTREHRPKPASPKELVAQMSDAQKRKTFGEAGTKALAAGADLGQVVNARRGMQSATVFGRKLQVTSEGTTRRGFAGKRLRNKTPRLMPEEIFRIADDRAHA
ncbi:hypothetical protein ACFCW6_38680, partial [Streptomyces sp. NPDC056333]